MHLHGECKGRSLAPMLRTTRPIRTLNALLLTLGGRGVAAQAPAPAPALAPRLVTVADLFRLRDVADPQLSPDGAWVAYTVTRADSAEDKQPGAVWMTSWDGSRTLRLTNSKEGESAPHWSPDGRWLAFLSSRQDEHTQLWLLERAGGEGRKLTSFGGDVEDYVWAPDGKRLAAVVGDADTAKPKTPAPIVIERFQFKQDEIGYLGKERRHLYLVDVETGHGTILTPGQYDELLPAWSPNGRSLVFVSKRRVDFDRDNNWDLYVMDAVPGAVPRQLTTFEGPDNDPETESRPAWSPDGRSIGCLQGGPLKLIYYGLQRLAVVPAAGGTPRVLTAALDRSVANPTWSPDGAAMLVQPDADRPVQLARIPAAGGAIERLIAGARVVTGFTTAPGGRVAVAVSTPDAPAEVYAVEGAGKALRPLSRQNDAWLKEVKLAPTEPITFESRDGTMVNGLVVKPPDARAGARQPAILRIHGGPVSQFQYEFSHLFQVLAARGYLVVVANARSSSGRGGAYATAIYADWENRDAQDVLGAVDYVVSQGLADPARLGVGGWSYGGILTNYVIAQDRRFNAAASGASASNILAGYGTDQYVRDYEEELGVP